MDNLHSLCLWAEVVKHSIGPSLLLYSLKSNILSEPLNTAPVGYPGTSYHLPTI